MITISSLTKSYGGKRVIDIDRLSIESHSCFGLVGNNGAGKTTLLRLILDLIEPDTGTVTSGGEEVARHEAWKRSTASFLDESFLIPFLTPEEYFSFVAKAYGITPAEAALRLKAFDAFFNEEVLGQKKFIRDFSTGNKRKIGIASALMIQPSVLVLDEPFANLDPSSQIRLVRILKELAAGATTTIILSSHDLAHVASVCSRIALIDHGKIILNTSAGDGTLAELQHYFGAES